MYTYLQNVLNRDCELWLKERISQVKERDKKSMVLGKECLHAMEERY